MNQRAYVGYIRYRRLDSYGINSWNKAYPYKRFVALVLSWPWGSFSGEWCHVWYSYIYNRSYVAGISIINTHILVSNDTGGVQRPVWADTSGTFHHQPAGYPIFPSAAADLSAAPPRPQTELFAAWAEGFLSTYSRTSCYHERFVRTWIMIVSETAILYKAFKYRQSLHTEFLIALAYRSLLPRVKSISTRRCLQHFLSFRKSIKSRTFTELHGYNTACNLPHIHAM